MRQRTMKTKSKETRSKHPGSFKFKNWFSFIALSSQQHENYFVSRVSSMFLSVINVLLPTYNTQLNATINLLVEGIKSLDLHLTKHVQLV